MVIVYKNYVTLLSTLENHVFSPFMSYSTLIRPRWRPNKAESFAFDQTLKLRLEIRLISSNYI